MRFDDKHPCVKLVLLLNILRRCGCGLYSLF